MHNVPFLREGTGETPRDGGCIMQVVDWISTEGWTDAPLCVFPYLAETAIETNDSTSDEERQGLLDLTGRFMGTGYAPSGISYTKQQLLPEEEKVMMDRLIQQLEDYMYENKISYSVHGLTSLLDEFDRLDQQHGYTNRVWKDGKLVQEQIDYSAVCAVLPPEYIRSV